MKCRLQKKIERTVKEELLLLVEQGYLTEFCKVSSDLVGEEKEKKLAILQDISPQQ
jgi:hypothetical protein